MFSQKSYSNWPNYGAYQNRPGNHEKELGRLARGVAASEEAVALSDRAYEEADFSTGDHCAA